MIHLAITENYLICAKWRSVDGKNYLSTLAHEAFSESLLKSDRTVSDIVSDIDSVIQLVRKEIAFEGEKVFVSIPDEFCHSALVPLDKEMTENDGWEFAKWTINQRWPENGDFEYFGRYFDINDRTVFAIRLSRAFADPLKIAIQELSCDTIWMGTESSAFFGLNPKRGSTVIYPMKSGYRYYTYSPNSFHSGTARHYDNSWLITPHNGSSLIKDIFKGQIFILGALSSRRKKHFGSKRIVQLSTLSGFIIEGNVFPKNLKNEDQDKLFVLTPVANGLITGTALNFFNQPGFQKYIFAEPETSLPIKNLDNKLEDKSIIENKIKVRKKIKSSKKKGNFKKNLLYLFFFFVITLVIIREYLPDWYSKIKNYISIEVQKNKNTIELLPVEAKSIATSKVSPLDLRLLDSQSLIFTAKSFFNMFSTDQISSFSIDKNKVDIEYISSKDSKLVKDSMGDILNYSLRQVSGKESFLHGYLISYPKIDLIPIREISTFDSLKVFASSLNPSIFKSLEPINLGAYIKTPLIVKIDSYSNTRIFLDHLELNSSNIFLEKLTYEIFNSSIGKSSVFFISVYDSISLNK